MSANNDVTLIIPVDSNVPAGIINEIVQLHRRQYPDLEIIISSSGVLTGVNDCIVKCSEKYDVFSLSRTRNAGALASSRKLLLFCDIDITFGPIIDDMIAAGNAVKGISRYDRVNGITGRLYRCANSPLLIQKDLFESIGGYCEEYAGWGFEDADFEHKLCCKMIDFDSRAIHIWEIHSIVSSNKAWNHGSENNRALFETRLKLPLEERIRNDIAVYNTRKASL